MLQVWLICNCINKPVMIGTHCTIPEYVQSGRFSADIYHRPRPGNIMRITVEFVTSVAGLDQLPRKSLPEIALIGRSNAGKSSMINALLCKAGLARTSNTPGCTQTLK